MVKRNNKEGVTGIDFSEPPVPQMTEPIPPVSQPAKWDEEADVVVVGGGGAGLCAAVKAKEKGASVIVIESMRAIGGSSAHSSVAFGFGSKAMKRKGVVVDEEMIYKQAIEASGFTMNPWLLRMLIRKSGETLDWIEGLGIEWEVMDTYNVPNCHIPKGARERTTLQHQKETTDLLFKEGEKKGVKFMVKTKLLALVRREDRIVGIKAKREGSPLFIRAKKGVILAAGGMSHNRELLKKYIPWAHRCVSSFVLPFATGEVFRAGLGAGADIAGFNTCSVFEGGVPYLEKGKGLFFRYLYCGDSQLLRQPWLYVNKACERFITEDPTTTEIYSSLFPFTTLGQAQMSQPGGRFYVIFDSDYEKNIWLFKGEWEERPLTPDEPGMKEWPERFCPKDWRIAVKKAIELNMIKISPTIEELAVQLGLNPVKLKERVISYNKMCELGKDTEFGKKREFLLPIKKAPFYGIEAGAQLEETYCGLRVNTSFQVLDKNCEVIPGLYAAFHTAGGAIGENVVYESVLGNVGLAYTSGYVAGDSAA